MSAPSNAMLLLAVTLLAGCADAGTPTRPTESLGGMPADLPTVRAQPQPFFVAFELGGDPANPLAIMAGYEPGFAPEDVCADPAAGSGGVGKAVATPPGGFLAHAMGRDVNLSVFAYGAGPITTPCELVGSPLVGSGTGKFTYNVMVTGPGAFVVHIAVHGTVDLVSGGQARLLATARVVVRPDGTLLFDEERVRLTPI